VSIRLTLLALVSALSLGAAVPGYAQDHAHAEHGASDIVTLGDLEISGPFTRATLPNAPVGGGFFTVTNKGSADDRLVSASTSIAKDTQIHEMGMEGEVMKMRQLKDGIVIPAGSSVTLEPGGMHLMFMGLTGPIKEGDNVQVTLTFEKAGEVTLDLVAGGTAADMAHGDMEN